MKRTEAARYARWSAGVAIALVVITLGVYLQRAVKAHIERKNAPPPAPPTVAKLSTGLTFSKVEQNRTLFTVRAAKSTEYQGSATDVLEDVQITVFGRKGDRHDTIHTSSCQYSKDTGKIACAGEVQIDLQSAADAARAVKNPAAVRMLHVETRGVSFNRESGLASTKEKVKFTFSNGDGEARGVDYRSEEGTVRLENDVKLRLKAPAARVAAAASGAGAGSEREVNVTGASLEYRHEARAMRLAGPVHAASSGVELSAGELMLELDANYNAQRMVARPAPGNDAARPEVISKKEKSAGRVTADEFVAHFTGAGWVDRVDGTGRVEGEITKGTATTKLAAERFRMDLAGKTSEPQKLTASGNVRTETRAPLADGSGARIRRVQAEAMRLDFAPTGRNGAAQVQSAETLARGSLEWEDTAGGNNAVQKATQLEADKLHLNMKPTGQPADATARGNVHVRRTMAGKPEQSSTAREGDAKFDEKGEWTEIVLRGDVRLRQDDRRGQADTATFSQATQTALLTGNVVASDATTRTTARAITFMQGTGEINASGGVRTTDLGSHGSTVHLAEVPANLSSDALQANSQTGRALYSGHARLWQGESLLEADSIELLKNERGLNANRNVRGVFPQAAFKPATAAGDGGAGGGPAGGAKKAGGKPADASSLWHVQADTLNYRDTESRAHLEGKVVAQSGTQSIHAPVLDLYFVKKDGAGAQQLTRAVGTGGVMVSDGVRRGTAERGEYTAAEGKFVLSGGTPTIYDGAGGVTTGRQLTFFLADDTIIVESENGTRTLTKHRVEK
jgi:lipopolysaccharide export system protein LptA